MIKSKQDMRCEQLAKLKFSNKYNQLKLLP
jgi:hypothetical protein